MGKNSSVIDSSEQIQNIILFLNGSEGLSKHVDPFMQMLSLMEPKEGTPLVLAPLLSDDARFSSFSYLLIYFLLMNHEVVAAILIVLMPFLFAVGIWSYSMVVEKMNLMKF